MPLGPERSGRRRPPRGHAAGIVVRSAYGSCPDRPRPKPADDAHLSGGTLRGGHRTFRHPPREGPRDQPTAVPNRLPSAYVTPAAAPPSRSWRSPLYHQVRAVTLATTAPHRKSPASAVSTAGHSEAAPSR